jgi:hypothetical protein
VISLAVAGATFALPGVAHAAPSSVSFAAHVEYALDDSDELHPLRSS